MHLISQDDNTAFNDFCVEEKVTPEDIYRMTENELDDLIIRFKERNNADPDAGRD